MRTSLIGLLCVKTLLAQPQTNTMSGSCDQVINDNRGVITITCSGVDKTLMEQLKKTAGLLNRIASRQTDPTIMDGLKVLNTKMDEVLSDTRNLKTTVVQTARQLAAEQQQKEQAELLRRTPPDIDPFLRIDENGKLQVMLRCRNLVPFEFKYFITRPDSTMIPAADGSFSIWTTLAKVYPSPGNTLFNSTTDIKTSGLRGQEIELHLYFNSLSADELNLPGHRGEIVKKYRVAPDGTALEPHP